MHRSTSLFSSLLFLGFALFFFYTNPSRPLDNMAEETPKSIYEFTVKVLFSFILIAFLLWVFFMNLFGFVNLECWVFAFVLCFVNERLLMGSKSMRLKILLFLFFLCWCF